jgi:hypothetical protein
MSTTAARRRRLMVARTFRQARCAECGTDLSRVEFPAIHLDRCERLAEARRLERELATPPGPAGPSLRQRLTGWLGLTTRGAAE